jgi:hypothetical protein
MTDICDESDLDSIFNEARAAARIARRTAAKDKPATPKAEPARLYSDPANWKMGRTVALIHKDTETLLGTFVEWLHVSVPEARKLVRNEDVTVPAIVEYVSGEWGDRGPAVPVHPTSALVQALYATLPVSLIDPYVFAAQVEVVAYVQGQGILRVELSRPTTFASALSIFSLPASLNILQVMSRDSKIALRKELVL